jgi:hypothetical protein
LVNVDDKGRVPAFVRSNGLVVGNLFVSDVLESSILLNGQNSSRKWQMSFGAASGWCSACRLKLRKA